MLQVSFEFLNLQKTWSNPSFLEKSITIFLLVFYLISPNSYGEEEKWPVVSFPSCSFYKKVEKIVKCKNNGSNYLESYGEYYCNEFSSRMPKWSEQLKKWTINTGTCLQEMILDNRKNRLSPCKQMEEFAFDVHPICYKQYGVCDLSLNDHYNILSVIRKLDLITNFRRSLTQFINVNFACISEGVSEVESATFDALRDRTRTSSIEARRLAYEIFESAPLDLRSRKKYFFSALLLVSYGSLTLPAMSSFDKDDIEVCLDSSNDDKFSEMQCPKKLGEIIGKANKLDSRTHSQKILNVDSIGKILKQLRNRHLND